MLALMKPKNAVTVSIIATVLSALATTETTGGAAQSKGFRTGCKNRNPTDDLEQHRVPERGVGRLFRLVGLRRCGFLRALGHHRVIFRSAAPRRSALRQAAHPVRHVGDAFRPAFGRRRNPIAPGMRGTEGPIGGPRNNSFGRDAIALWLPPRAIKAGARRFRGDDGRGGDSAARGSGSVGPLDHIVHGRHDRRGLLAIEFGKPVDAASATAAESRRPPCREGYGAGRRFHRRWRGNVRCRSATARLFGST